MWTRNIQTRTGRRRLPLLFFSNNNNFFLFSNVTSTRPQILNKSLIIFKLGYWEQNSEMYGRSDGGGRVGRLGSRSSVIPAGDPLEEPITEQTHFGKRMGANLFYREDLTVFGNGGGQRPKHSSSKTNANSSSSHLGIGTGKERGIYKTELLEKESNSSQIGGFNYRKKSANHNTPTNSVK